MKLTSPLTTLHCLFPPSLRERAVGLRSGRSITALLLCLSIACIATDDAPLSNDAIARADARDRWISCPRSCNFYSFAGDAPAGEIHDGGFVARVAPIRVRRRQVDRGSGAFFALPRPGRRCIIGGGVLCLKRSLVVTSLRGVHGRRSLLFY